MSSCVGSITFWANKEFLNDIHEIMNIILLFELIIIQLLIVSIIFKSQPVTLVLHA